MSNALSSLQRDDVESLAVALGESTVEWIKAIQETTTSRFNDAKENVWSPAQILMHMILSEKGIADVLTGPAQPPEKNRRDMFDRIERGLTDYERKIVAPSFLDPRNEAYDKDRLLLKFKNTRETLLRIMLESSEIDNVFTYPYPFFGPLTGKEWIYSIWLHANRHFLQLQRALQTA